MTGKQCGSSGAGLRPIHTEGTYVQEDDLLRYQPNGGAPRGLLSQTCHPYRLHPHTPLASLNPGPVLPKFPFAQVCVECLLFKDTEPSPVQNSFSVRQKGGSLIPGPPPPPVTVIPVPESIAAQAV